MNYNSPKWSSNKLADLNAAKENTLKVQGRPAILLPTLTLDENHRVAPKESTIKKILEVLRDTGNYYRWAGLGPVDYVTYIERDGSQKNLTLDWKIFYSQLSKDVVFVQFSPGSTSEIEQRAITPFETMKVIGAAVFGMVLKKISWGEVATFRTERRKQPEAPTVKPIVVDPATVSNEAYLNS